MRKLRLAAAISTALLAVACGGSDSSVSATPGSGTTGSAVGVLTDAEIAGVQYTTSSGVTGTTDAQGRYNYNPGDTVTFKVGALTLGAVPATGIITPIQLAAGSTTKLDNLLVVLQSLDSDGDPSNGINIPAAAATAITSSFDLGSNLGSTATQTLQSAMTAGGITSPVKTAADAKRHFISQAMSLLSSNVWVGYENSVPAIAIRFKADGSFLMGQATPTEAGVGTAGVEVGSLNITGVDPNGFSWTSSVNVDTNGQWGFSHPLLNERFSVDGEALTFFAPDGTSTFGKMENNNASMVGAWAFQNPADHRGLFLFFSSGYVMFLDPEGDQDPTPCGGAGIELGRYTYNASTGIVTPTGPIYDTNGCAGYFEASVNPTTHSFTLSSDGMTAVLSGTDAQGSWTDTLVRVSK